MKLYFHEDDLTVGGAAVCDDGANAVTEASETVASLPEGSPESVAPSAELSADAETTDAASVSAHSECAEAQNTSADEERPAVGGQYAPEGAIPTLGDGETVLSVRNLYKGYQKGSCVLSNFSLDVAKGQIVGLLGPNGCGKTTLLKMIAGLLVPDRGEILVAGEPRTERSNLNISYLPERTYFTPGMRVSALLDYFADFYEDFSREKAYAMLKSLEVDPKRKLKTLSKGTKEKVQLVLVMARNAKLYLLDEPIAGVDPVAREFILDTIIANYNKGATVLVSTHLISDVEKVLDSFIFVRNGKIIMQGDVAKAREAYEGKTLDEIFREVYKQCSQKA